MGVPSVRNRQEISLSLNNIYDYKEFCDTSSAEGVELISWVNYATMVQTLQEGLKHYPELAPRDAYLQAIADNNNTLVFDRANANDLPETDTSQETKTGCCGGGEVR